ncbi:hypothetical protein [Sphingomonas sp.]|uniref:hypothetical protein n=1 Tax=Sphingomonas sp. TaxID=28214 RepID=UPI000DB7643C|nr:hypothetical protein [Sphingomonas sp.]PZU10176.1 MAG: hypothetical protein DI605_06175 [Sphingomonas sp.]
MRTAFSFMLAAALIAGGASARPPKATPINAKGEAALAKLLEGRVAGKPVSCISAMNSQSSQVIDGTAVVYQSTGRTIYVNRPRVGADQLDSDDILVTRIWGSQLCSLDQVRLVDRTSRFPRGFVGLGEFVPYTKAKKG